MTKLDYLAPLRRLAGPDAVPTMAFRREDICGGATLGTFASGASTGLVREGTVRC